MDVDAKAKEVLFLKDRVYQLEIQVSILQKQQTKKGTKPRYEVRERLLSQWNIKPRVGAVGKHGSIAVTERVIKTLKYE